MQLQRPWVWKKPRCCCWPTNSECSSLKCSFTVKKGGRIRSTAVPYTSRIYLFSDARVSGPLPSFIGLPDCYISHCFNFFNSSNAREGAHVVGAASRLRIRCSQCSLQGAFRRGQMSSPTLSAYWRCLQDNPHYRSLWIAGRPSMLGRRGARHTAAPKRPSECACWDNLLSA